MEQVTSEVVSNVIVLAVGLIVIDIAVVIIDKIIYSIASIADNTNIDIFKKMKFKKVSE